MAIKDLEVRQGKVDVTVEVVDKGSIREFEKFGKSGRVCNAKVRDETGEISMTLWNDDIDKVNVGDRIHIVNGYVSEWQGEKQLSTGKFGSIEVVESQKPMAKASEDTPQKKKGAAKKEPEEEEETADEDDDSIDEDIDVNEEDVI